MFNKTIHAKALQGFKECLHGELIGPGDDNYESARRVWNGMIDKYPALIARLHRGRRCCQGYPVRSRPPPDRRRPWWRP